MEIRKVEKIKPNYPEMKNISKSKIKNSIPNKWAKMGISTFLIEIIMKKQTVVEAVLDPAPGLVADPVPKKEFIFLNEISDYILVVTIVSAVIFFINIIVWLLKEDDKEEVNKSNKKLKIILIISSIIFVLSIIAQILLD